MNAHDPDVGHVDRKNGHDGLSLVHVERDLHHDTGHIATVGNDGLDPRTAVSIALF